MRIHDSLPFALAIALTTSATSACTAGLHLGGSSSGSVRTGGSDSSGSSGDSVAEGGDAKAGAPATKFSDFAFEVKDATGTYTSGWIIDKLTQFDVSPACYEKMVDKNNSAIHSATFYVRDVADLAKTLTGDSWDDIESSGNSDREKNKKFVEPMIEKFKDAYSLTISIEGDDCDASFNALWLGYWTSISTALKNYPPASGKARIKLAVLGSARDISVNVDDATSTYTITAPRDIEAKGAWDEKLEKPFRKRARQQ